MAISLIFKKARIIETSSERYGFKYTGDQIELIAEERDIYEDSGTGAGQLVFLPMDSAMYQSEDFPSELIYKKKWFGRYRTGGWYSDSGASEATVVYAFAPEDEDTVEKIRRTTEAKMGSFNKVDLYLPDGYVWIPLDCGGVIDGSRATRCFYALRQNSSTKRMELVKFASRNSANNQSWGFESSQEIPRYPHYYVYSHGPDFREGYESYNFYAIEKPHQTTYDDRDFEWSDGVPFNCSCYCNYGVSRRTGTFPPSDQNILNFALLNISNASKVFWPRKNNGIYVPGSTVMYDESHIYQIWVRGQRVRKIWMKTGDAAIPATIVWHDNEFDYDF